MRFIILIAVASYCSLLSEEYLYPVGASLAQERVYVVYQKSLSHIELWEWDYQTRQANQLLLSRYSPAGFRLLPDESGFSFIDQGILKVKQFIKRSPRTISFDAPISHVELVYWIDAKTCYASGKYLDCNGIFQIDWDGSVYPLIYHSGYDALYPQKIDSSLFYIERNKQESMLMQIAYEPNEQEEWHDRISRSEGLKGTPLFSFNEPVAFLKMVSDSEGFVVGYPAEIRNQEHEIIFTYYHLIGSLTDWKKEKLFTFCVPTKLLHAKSGERLYESILPLMPQHYDNQIYFVDASSTNYLALYRFDLARHEITCCAYEDQHIFGLCGMGKKIWFGGGLSDQISLLEGFRIELLGIDKY